MRLQLPPSTAARLQLANRRIFRLQALLLQRHSGEAHCQVLQRKLLRLTTTMKAERVVMARKPTLQGPRGQSKDLMMRKPHHSSCRWKREVQMRRCLQWD